MSKRLERRLEALERAAGDGEEEHVVYFTRLGCDVTEADMEAALELSRRERPGQLFRVIFLRGENARADKP